MTNYNREHPRFTAATNEQAQEKVIAPELVHDYVKMQLEVILGRVLSENTPYTDVSHIATESTGKILGHLKERKIGKILSIKQVGYHIVISYKDTAAGEKHISFDINSQKNYISTKDPETILKEERQKKKALRDENEALSSILSAMEEVFSQNGGGFGELNSSDILNTNTYDTKTLQLKGKTIIELQKLAQDRVVQIKLLRLSVFDTNTASDILVQENFETYLGYITGIGLGKSKHGADYYEGGAKLFPKSEQEVSFLIEELLSSKHTNEAILVQLSEIHQSIDSNNYQSSTVEKSYKYFIDKINHSLFHRLKESSASPEEFLAYARLMSGRDFTLGGKTYSGEMDSRLYSPEMATKGLLEAMTNSTGMIEQMNSNLQIEDELVGKKTPKDIYNTASKCISETMTTNSGEKVDGKSLLQQLKFDDLANNDTSYEGLSYTDKIRTSTLARLIEKLKPEFWYDPMNPEHYSITDPQYKISDLTELFKEISTDAVSDMNDSLSHATDWTWEEAWKEGLANVDGTTAHDLGFETGSTEAQIYETFRDISGAGGIFELSDNSQGYLKDAAMMGAIVVGAMVVGTIIIATLPVTGAVIGGVNGALLATAAANNLLIQGGIYGVSASMTSWGVDYAVGDAKGYDTLGEAAVNISTDLFVGGATGMFGGYLVSRYGVEGAKALSMGGVKNKGIFAGDLAILGVGAEAGRIRIMDQIFHKDDIFIENTQSK